MGKAWRWRQCPKCERVFPAGELEVLGLPGAAWTDGGTARGCPRCGHADYTKAFRVVRELKAGQVVSYAPVKLPPLPAYECRVCGAAMSVARVSQACGGLRPCRLPIPDIRPAPALPVLMPEVA